jgi:betaine-aldehyde dehydrogenase
VRRLRNFVNGEPVDPADGRTAPVVNPATGETIAEAAVKHVMANIS